MIFRSHFKRCSTENGFSFLSMSILILFISMGAAMVITMLPSSTDSGSTEDTFKKMTAIQDAINVYKNQHGSSAPNNLDDLVTKTGPNCDVDRNQNSATYRTLQGWCGPYLEREFTNSSTFKEDGWGTALQYDKINIKSCGPNRKCGDGDDIAIAI